MADAYQYKEYVESDAVKQAQALLQQQQAAKPGAYQSQWQTSLNETLDKILNREKFNYDLNGDALYQQYKDQYVMQGQKAMMDTMGQAQAMTGGYGNSYAQTAGQQTYQGYLQQLNDKVPELYQLALNKYQMEGDALMNQYGLMADQEDKDYGRYRDSVSDWQSEVDRLQSQYNAERDYDYSKYTNDRDFSYGQYVDDRNYQYQVDRDAIADQQWQTSFEYQQNRDQIADEQWQKEFDEAVRQYNESLALQQAAKSSGGSSGGGGSYNNSGYSSSVVQQAQAFVGTAVDGMWGANSTAAAKAKGYNSLAEVVAAMGGSPAPGGTTGFSGSTYSEAAAYLKNNGQSASGLMTQSEWQRHKNGNNSAGGEHQASTYAEYLAAYIYGATK